MQTSAAAAAAKAFSKYDGKKRALDSGQGDYDGGYGGGGGGYDGGYGGGGYQNKRFNDGSQYGSQANM